jgi:hypothetical protein
LASEIRDLETLKRKIFEELDKEHPFKLKEPSESLIRLIEDYLKITQVFFDTKMEAYKMPRAERFTWEKPILEFSIIRHPGGQTRQTWVFNFDSNEAALVSEGKIPQSKPFFVYKDAEDIVDAIVKGEEHPCVSLSGDRIVVNPRKIEELANAPKETVDGRVKRMKNRIKEMMKDNPRFEETSYRNMLAYRQINDEDLTDK